MQSITGNVHEVGCFASFLLNHVDSSHARASPVFKNSYVSLELDEVKAEVRGLTFISSLLRRVELRPDFSLPVKCIVIDRNLAILSNESPVFGVGKWIQLQKGTVADNE